MKKARDLAIIAGVYLLAYAAGVAACFRIPSALARFAVFDAVATVVTFLFSLLFRNSSVYDAYWSLTPMVISVWLFCERGAFSPWQIAVLTAFQIWSLRLTLNWAAVFTDFGYEDWRYRKYRNDTIGKPFLWFVVNFFGIHLVPTVVVFAGMLPLFELSAQPLGAGVLPGVAVMLAGVALEFFADRAMHAHLREAEAAGVKTVCERGLWRYSRHPNYLGEIAVWLGLYLAMLPYAPAKWYNVVGVGSVFLLFNAVSVPLMEKRQLARRPDYAEYRKTTSRLLLLPRRKSKAKTDGELSIYEN